MSGSARWAGRAVGQFGISGVITLHRRNAMIPRLAASLLFAVLACSCADNPSPLRLVVTVSPNPISAPAGPGDVFYDLELRASGSGTVRVERGDVQLLDAAGAKVGHSRPFFSRSAGCSVCSTDVSIAAGRSEMESQLRALCRRWHAGPFGLHHVLLRRSRSGLDHGRSPRSLDVRRQERACSLEP
jgi:hypothetical protein